MTLFLVFKDCVLPAALHREIRHKTSVGWERLRSCYMKAALDRVHCMLIFPFKLLKFKKST